MASAGEVAYCQASIENNVRLDGRQCLHVRPVELELAVIAQAAGSARVHLGATDVLVGVKVRGPNTAKQHNTVFGRGKFTRGGEPVSCVRGRWCHSTALGRTVAGGGGLAVVLGA